MAQEIDPTAEDKMMLNVLKTLIPHPFFFIFSPGQRATMALTKLLQMLWKWATSNQLQMCSFS